MTCAQLEKNLREAFAAEAEAETPDDNALAHARVWAAIDGMTAPPRGRLNENPPRRDERGD